MYIDQLKALKKTLELNRKNLQSDSTATNVNGKLVCFLRETRIELLRLNLRIEELDEKIKDIPKTRFRYPFMLKEEQKRYKNLFRYYFLEIASLNPDLPVDEIVEDAIQLIEFETGLLEEYSKINVAKTVKYLRENGYFDYNCLQEELSGVTVTKKGRQYIKTLLEKPDVKYK